jgi:tRNA (cytosine38-C5)-methyltransferase
MCLSQTMNITSQDSDLRTEEELDPICKPVKDFLGE